MHAVHNPIVTSNVKGKLQSPNSQTTPDDAMFGTLEGNTGLGFLNFNHLTFIPNLCAIRTNGIV